MALTHQPSLLDLADTAQLARPLTDATRTELAGGAWVDHLPAWVVGSDEVLDRLLGAVPWRAERREMYDRVVDVPRLLASYAEPGQLPHPVLRSAHGALSAHYAPELGEPFAGTGLCLYRDGRDSVAWHGDTLGRGATTDTIVAIVSFGSASRAAATAPRRRTPPAVRARARRPAGHGRVVPAHVGARRPEERRRRGATGQRAVPARGRRVSPAVRCAASACTSTPARRRIGSRRPGA